LKGPKKYREGLFVKPFSKTEKRGVFKEERKVEEPKLLGT
jgi:hypothetical protein